MLTTAVAMCVPWVARDRDISCSVGRHPGSHTSGAVQCTDLSLSCTQEIYTYLVILGRCLPIVESLLICVLEAVDLLTLNTTASKNELTRYI